MPTHREHGEGMFDWDMEEMTGLPVFLNQESVPSDWEMYQHQLLKTDHVGDSNVLGIIHRDCII